MRAAIAAALKAMQQPIDGRADALRKVVTGTSTPPTKTSSTKSTAADSMSILYTKSLSSTDVVDADADNTSDETIQFSETDDNLLLLAVARLRPYSGEVADQTAKWQSISVRLSSTKRATVAACRARCLHLLRDADSNVTVSTTESMASTSDADRNRVMLLKIIRKDILREMETQSRANTQTPHKGSLRPKTIIETNTRPEAKKNSQVEKNTPVENRMLPAAAKSKRSAKRAITAHLTRSIHGSGGEYMEDSDDKDTQAIVDSHSDHKNHSEANEEADDSDTDDDDFVIVVRDAVNQPKVTENKSAPSKTNAHGRSQPLSPVATSVSEQVDSRMLDRVVPEQLATPVSIPSSPSTIRQVALLSPPPRDVNNSHTTALHVEANPEHIGPPSPHTVFYEFVFSRRSPSDFPRHGMVRERIDAC